MFTPPYDIADASGVYSPGLIFFADLIRKNLARAVELAGSVERLRPHVKTHKCPDVVKIELAAGIVKHKVATLAEAEMVATCGAPDVLIAYPLVGPNVARFVTLVERYPRTRFSVVVDHPDSVAMLSEALHEKGLSAEALVDLDVGQHRTGIAPGPEAVELYEAIDKSPGLTPAGLHVYDGHNNLESFVERQKTAVRGLEPALRVRETLLGKGLPVPRIVTGGTPTFPVYARMDVEGLECSPGTLVLHDQGYGSRYPDITGFVPAALLLTRVISRPTPTRVTFDLGYKAVASDPPAGKRLVLLEMPDHEAVLQNEEHLVVDTPHAAEFKPGDERLAIPAHACPTVALHRQAYVVEGGKVVGMWDIAARDRVIGV